MMSSLLALAASLPAACCAATVTVDLATDTAVVPAGIYGAGYNGWGDLTDPRAVERLQELPLRFIRIDVDPALICGDEPGEYDLQYHLPRDGGVGFLDRLKLIREHGWEPLLALEISHKLPPWFHGNAGDADGEGWFRYDADGTFHEGAFGDQWDAWAGVARDIAARLKAEGLSGLYWETAYELGHTAPLAQIHYYGAKGIKEADPTAMCMGPATWPGWTVEERFVKPYLAAYPAALLDYVSVHWYANNEHGLWDTGYDPADGVITMADDLWLRCLMEVTPKLGWWSTRLRALLADAKLNPTGKRIGVAFTELDANAYSPYMRSPANESHPEYDPAADCYVNTNVFGGVWNASALCNLMKSGACDIAMKYNTRQYYGLIDHGPDDEYMRTPVWYAMYMLSEVAGLKAGAELVASSVEGPTDSAKEHVGGEDSPWLECTARADEAGFALVLTNRGPESEAAEVSIRRIPDGEYEATWYRFDASRCQRFIGRPAAQEQDGRFESESVSLCLEPTERTRLAAEGGALELSVECPGTSITVLTATKGMPTPGG